MKRQESVWCLALVLMTAIGCERPEGDVGETTTAPAVLVRGAQLHGTNGIHFGPDGRLWVASVATPALVALDPESGEILERLGPDDGARGPDDLAFGPDGSLYWTDITYGEVGKRTPAGESSVVANLGPGVNPITFSDDGRLFVSQCFFGDKLFEVDPEGVEEPRLISDRLGPGCGLNGMDWGPDGRLYGPRWFNGEVVRVDVDSGSFETAVAGFGVPAAVKFDSQGRLHVLDTQAGEVVRVDLEGGGRETVGRIVAGLDNLAFSADDRLFVSSFADGFVVEVLDESRNRTVSGGGLNLPGGLALHGSGDSRELYVADFFALRSFDPVTGEERSVTRDILGVSELGATLSVAVDGENLILASWFDNQVKVWSPAESRPLRTITGLGRPIQAIRFGGDLLVTEHDSGSVLRISDGAGSEGEEERQTVASGLTAPAGLVAEGGSLWVSDQAAGTVLELYRDNRQLDTPAVLAAELAGPEGMTIADGELYVVEAGAGRVTAIELLGGVRRTVVEGLDLHLPPQGAFPPTMLFNGIVVDGDEVIVTGDRGNLLYRIARR